MRSRTGGDLLAGSSIVSNSACQLVPANFSVFSSVSAMRDLPIADRNGVAIQGQLVDVVSPQLSSEH